MLSFSTLMTPSERIHSKYLEMFLENSMNYVIMMSHANRLMKEEIDEYLKTKDITKIYKDVYIHTIKTIFPLFDLNYDKFIEFQTRNFILFLYSEFQNYLYKWLKYIYEKRPHLLDEKQISIKIKSILDNTIDLKREVEYKIDRQIEQNLRKDFNDFFNFIHNKLGIHHNLTEEQILKLKEMEHIRHLFAHGDGTVNHIFLFYISDSEYKIGDKINITIEKSNEFWQKILEIIFSLDESFLISYPELAVKSAFMKVA